MQCRTHMSLCSLIVQDGVEGRRRLFNNLGRRRILVFSAGRKDWGWEEVDEGHKYHLRKMYIRGPKQRSQQIFCSLIKLCHVKNETHTVSSVKMLRQFKVGGWGGDIITVQKISFPTRCLTFIFSKISLEYLYLFSFLTLNFSYSSSTEFTSKATQEKIMTQLK